MKRDWHAILSGERRDAAALLLRGVLTLATPVYATAVAVRGWTYDRGWRRQHPCGLPVISLGNLTTGGTGKTPLVAWTVNHLRQSGAHPGILSRGYRSIDGEANDEKRLLDALCPEVPHVQNPDRVAGATVLREQHGCNVLVLDDGFQHRRLARDLDMVLIDALTPWGYGSLLPRGLMREPPSALKRAHLVCLTRADQVDERTRRTLHDQITHQTKAPIVEVAFRPTGLVNARGVRAPLTKLQSAAVGACCGIGNPQALLRTLTAIAAPPTADRFRAYPDHHHYTADDLVELAAWVQRTGIELLVVTRKDLVKLPQERIGRAELWALEIGIEFLSGEREFTDRLQTVADRGAERL